MNRRAARKSAATVTEEDSASKIAIRRHRCQQRHGRYYTSVTPLSKLQKFYKTQRSPRDYVPRDLWPRLCYCECRPRYGHIAPPNKLPRFLTRLAPRRRASFATCRSRIKKLRGSADCEIATDNADRHSNAPLGSTQTDSLFDSAEFSDGNRA